MMGAVSTARGAGVTPEARPSAPADGRDERLRDAPRASFWATARAHLMPAKGPQSFLATGITGGLLLLAWVCNLFHLPHPWESAAVGWLPGALALAVAAVALWATARIPT